jgi:hypothetical protein
MPSLRSKPGSAPIEAEERVICVESFRPGAVAGLIERGAYLPRNHRAVIAFPEYFRALVRLDATA